VDRGRVACLTPFSDAQRARRMGHPRMWWSRENQNWTRGVKGERSVGFSDGRSAIEEVHVPAPSQKTRQERGTLVCCGPRKPSRTLGVTRERVLGRSVVPTPSASLRAGSNVARDATLGWGTLGFGGHREPKLDAGVKERAPVVSAVWCPPLRVKGARRMGHRLCGAQIESEA
jgi:hypothetical protein